MQLFGTSFNLDLGGLRLRLSFGIEERDPNLQVTRIEELPRLELSK
jgi:hypothetical protein